MVIAPSPKFILFTGTAVVLALGACETFRSTPALDGQPVSEQSRNGIYYFLPKGRIQLHGEFAKDSGGQPTKDFLITIARLNEPDRDHRYFLEHTFSVLHDDDTGFTVDEHGLLQGSTTMHSIGRSGAIVQTLGETFLTLADAAARGVYLAGGTATAVPAVYPFTVTFDPFNVWEVREVQAQIHKCLGPSAYLEVDTRKGRVADSRRASLYDSERESYAGYQDGKESTSLRATTSIGSSSGNGIYYHPLTTVRITLGGYESNSFAFHKSAEIAVPDADSMAVFPFTRPVLVEKSVAVTFKDGEPQVIKYTYPSEALAVVTIPKNLATDLLNTLTNFTTFVSANKPLPNLAAANRNALLTERAGAVGQEVTLIQNLKTLETLQHPPPVSPTPTTIATPTP